MSLKLGNDDVSRVMLGGQEVSAIYKGTDEVWSAGGGGSISVGDVFSTYLYEGNGGVQTVINGIDLAGEGGMVWVKNRTSGALVAQHVLTDTESPKGTNSFYPFLSSNSTDPLNPADQGNIDTWNSDGFASFGNYDWNNKPSEKYVSWTFRRAPNFFDRVAWTGDGVAGREIPHNLGCEPGMIIVKCVDAAYSWNVYSRGMGATKYLRLNTSQAFTEDPEAWNDTEPTSTAFTLGDDGACNASGNNFVAYLFAHDSSGKSMMKSGIYTGNQTAGKQIDLGFEPQFVLIKAASGAGEWYMFDTMRGIVTGGFDPFLRANMTAAESASSEQLEVNPTGFSLSADINVNTKGVEYIYMAIKADPDFIMPPEWEQMNQEVAEKIARKEAAKEAVIEKVKGSKDIKDDS